MLLASSVMRCSMRCYDELLTSFQRTMQNQYPDIAFTLVPIDRYSKSQVELFQLMSEHRYFLQLSPIEGFGLTPLEAMGCGCLALGFHGSGGLEYMLPSGLRRNCATVAYPQMEKLCKNVALMLSKPGKAKKIATRGMPLIQKYSRNVFEKRWIEFFHKIIDCF